MVVMPPRPSSSGTPATHGELQHRQPKAPDARAARPKHSALLHCRISVRGRTRGHAASQAWNSGPCSHKDGEDGDGKSRRALVPRRDRVGHRRRIRGRLKGKLPRWDPFATVHILRDHVRPQKPPSSAVVATTLASTRPDSS
ncbi:hypothetical protein EJB05_12997, partial [Eragrostis curvula]